MMNGPVAVETRSPVKKEVVQTPEAIERKSPEYVFEQSGAEGLLEMARSEADQTAHEFEALSTHDEAAAQLAPTEVAELEQAKNEAVTEVHTAAKEFEDVMRALKAPVEIPFDEMIEEAEVAPEDETSVETEETMIGKARRTVDTRNVMDELGEQKRSELQEKAIADHRKLESLKERKALLERMVESAKRANETLGEIGIVEEKTQKEDLASIESEIEALAPQILEAEEAYEASSAEYDAFKRKQKTEQAKKGEMPATKEAAYAALVTAQKKLDQSQKALDGFLAKRGNGEQDEVRLKMLRAERDRNKINADFWTKEAEIAELDESIRSLEQSGAGGEEIEKLRADKQTKLSELEALQNTLMAREDEDEALIPLTQIKAIGIEHLPKDEEMVIEPTVSAEAQAAQKMEVPAGRTTSQEELEMSAEELETEAPPLDWEALKTEEHEKREHAEQEYKEVTQTLQAFRESRPKGLTPIEAKYVKALETQIQASEAAWKHAETQLELYDANERIEALSHGGDVFSSEIDQLIEKRNAKDTLSRQLAEQYEQAEQAHDAALAAYMKALETLQGGEQSEAIPENQTEQAHEEEQEDKEEEPQFGGGLSLTLNPEDADYEARQAGVKPKEISSPMSQENKEKKPGLMKRFFKAYFNWILKG